MYTFCRKSGKQPEIFSIRQLNEASLIYKNLHGSEDFNLKKINFDRRDKLSLRITRNGSELHTCYRRIAIGRKAVSVSEAKLWNSIPMNIKIQIPS